ncbi:MAG: hypothetical protein GY845_14030 [Planctomycetes bacterium]|nr:hypothetical protein [Planctomycetota bacterium]
MKEKTYTSNSQELKQTASRMGEDIMLTRSTFDRIAPILVFVTLVIGAGLRLSGLSDHTIGHTEIYVPGVQLPSHWSIPGPRLTFSTTITSTIVMDIHPPGYYLLMLPWTKCFGTSPLAIRLPSAIIGSVTILLIYLLGARLGLRKAGVLSSFLWAMAGLPIKLAQEARMYPLVCFLGVLATILLVESYLAGRSRQRFVVGAYVIAILAGLATSHFFWLILIAHMLYVQFGPTHPSRPAAPQAEWQLFVLALASPLLAIAVFQSGRPSYLSPNVWIPVRSYFGFLYVWYRGEIFWLSWVASLGCALLLVVGLLRTRRQTTRAANQSTIRCPRWLLYGVAALAFVSIEIFAWITHLRASDFTWLTRRTGVIVICGSIPLLALVMDSVIRRGLLSGWIKSCFGAPLGPIWLIAFLAVVPVSLMALISISIPLLAARTASLFAPYLMLLVSVGAVRLCRVQFARGLAVVFLLLLNTAGFLEYREQPHSPRDYKALAAQVVPRAQPEDLWFIVRNWVTSPIYYYLSPDQYTFVVRDYAQVLSKRPQVRVWVLGFRGLPPPTRVTAPLSGYRRLGRIEARGIYTDLYVPVSDDSTENTGAGDSDIELH